MNVKINYTKINNVNLDHYKSQSNVRRSKIAEGGFDYIVYATDQDLDGYHIRGLLTGFIEKYLPEFKNRIGMLQTPVLMFTKNGKVHAWKYNLDDKTEYKGEITYVKGIGSWNPDDLKYIISKDGLEKMIQKVDFQGLTGLSLIDEWLGDDSEPRKKYILKNNFRIAIV